MSQDNTIKFEQYFTNENVAKDCINLIIKDLKNNLQEDLENSKLHLIEPSCGEGVFVKNLKNIDLNLKITCVDIDSLYPQAIQFDFLNTNEKILNIKKSETIIFFGCPPSCLTKEFLQKCKQINQNSIVYFLLRETLLKKFIKNKVILYSTILKNYGHHVFLFKKDNYTTQSPYVLTKLTFTSR